MSGEAWLGSFVWLALLFVLPNLGASRLSPGALLFLLGPLLVTPLAMDVAARLVASLAGRLYRLARLLLPLGAWAAAGALLGPAGTGASALATAWLVATLLVLLAALAALATEARAGRAGPAALVALAAAHLVASALLLVRERLGAPPGTDAGNPLATACHLGIAGFATLVLAAAALADCRGPARRLLATAAIAVAVLLPLLRVLPALAAPEEAQELLRLGAALLLAAAVAAIAFAQVRHAVAGSHPGLRFLSSASALTGSLLAATGAWGTVTRMDATTRPYDWLAHAALLAFGFVLPGLVARRLEGSAAAASGREDFARVAPPPPAPPLADPAEAGDRQARLVLGLVACVFAAYRLLHATRLDHSAALFVGLPTLLLLLLLAMPPARSLAGIAVNTVTCLLLLSAVFLGEGFICVLMVAPIAYGIVVPIAWAADRKARRGRLLLLPLLPLGLEGTHPGLTRPRLEQVTAERVVEGSPDAVERALASTPRLAGVPLPRFLDLGFPKPLRAAGFGFQKWSRRVIEFEGGGALEMRVAERAPGHLRFVTVADTTAIAGWLGWLESDVRWDAAGPGRTRVRWTLRFERRLDPSWYFGPVERHAARLAADVLISGAATPPRTARRR